MPYHPQLLENLSQGPESGKGDSGDQEGYGDWEVIFLQSLLSERGQGWRGEVI